MNCRHCHAEVSLPFIDLGTSPPSNAYLTGDDLKKPESYFPLRVLVCEKCWLVQTQDFVSASELFSSEYAYFSSYSKGWLEHAEVYVRRMMDRFGLNKNSMVVEVAANDGYLLQFVKANGIPCLGIEPTRSTAAAAREKGIDIVEDFFGVKLATQLAQQGRRADLTCANNVLAHVPDINDFVSGFARLLKPAGVATFEFPHLLNLIKQNQFDTIYHEHYSYLSLQVVQTIFDKNGLHVFDVEEIKTHGGSLRVFAQRSDCREHAERSRIAEVLHLEQSQGLTDSSTYRRFQAQANKVKNEFLQFLLNARDKKIGAYGAAAKGNTLLNYAGVRPDLLPYIVDRNISKVNKFAPGSRIPIVDDQRIRNEKPDYVVILPWNLRDEISKQLAYIREWNGKFVTAVPQLEIF